MRICFLPFQTLLILPVLVLFDILPYQAVDFLIFVFLKILSIFLAGDRADIPLHGVVLAFPRVRERLGFS